MTLVRSSLLNSVAVGIKLLTALILNKVLAVTVGPGGYAIIGQFNGIVGIGQAVATGGITNGVVKYTAERQDTPDGLASLWSTGLRIVGVAAAAVGLALLAMAGWLAEHVLADVSLRSAFYWLAGSIVLFAANTILLAVLNGMKELRRYVLANVLGSVAGLLVTAVLALNYGLLGALVSVSISQSLALLFTLFACRTAPWFRPASLGGRFDTADARRLGGFSLMALSSAVSLPLTQVLVRNHLISSFGLNATGSWQGVSKISDMYLMLITSTLSVYYLPRLSEIRDNAEMRHEIVSAYRIVLPVSALAAVLIFAARSLLVSTLFSSDFAQMEMLFGWQLLGDVMRIGCWLVGFVLQAKAMTKRFILSELVYAATFYLLVRLLTPSFGVQGATIAYALSYMFYWLWVVVLLREFLFERDVPRDV